MPKTADRILIISLLILMVTVLGAVEGGATAGNRRWSFLVFCLPSTSCGAVTSSGEPTIHTTGISHTSIQHTTQTRRSTTFTLQSSTRSSSSSTSSSSPSTVAAGPIFPVFGVPGWFASAIAILLVGGGAAFLLIRGKKPEVLDLKGALGELEAQRKYFMGSWSAKIRNSALLKYYVLMAEICSKVGIVDRAEETPHQFIGRAALELKVEGEVAEEFAEVVDRAHYGAELSEDEVSAASGFMDSFTKALSGKVNIG